MVVPFRVFLAVLVFGAVVAGGKFAFAAEDFAPATKSLFLAVKKNDLGGVKRSLLDGADVTAETSGGLTSIDIAIDKGYFPIAHYLLAWRRHLRPKPSRPRLVPAPPAAEEPSIAEAPPVPEAPPATAATGQPYSAEPLPPAPPAAVSPLVASTYPQAPAQTMAPMPAPAPAPLPAQAPPPVSPQEPMVPSSSPDPAPPVMAPAAAVPAVPPVNPWGSPGRPEAAARPQPAPPVAEAEKTARTAKIVVPDEAEESPGILGRITDFFSFGSGENEEPPSPLKASPPSVERDSPPETASVTQNESEPKPRQSAETTPTGADPEPRPAAPAQGEARDSPGILDSIAGFFSSEPASREPPSGEPSEPAAAPIELAPTPQAPAEPETPPAPSVTAAPAEQAPPPQTSTEPVTLPAPYKTASPETTGDNTGILGRIASMLSSDPGKEAPVAETAAEPATASSPSGPAAERFEPAAPGKLPAPSVALSGVAGKSEAEPLETALLATPRPAPSPPAKAIEPVVGMSMKLGNARATESSNVCVRKKALDNWFCVEPVDWPDDIADAFQVHTTLYRGRKAIVRYEGGVVTQIHVLFPKGNFRAIIRHFTELFGAPAETTDNWAVLPGEPNRRNRTVRWRGAEAEGAGAGILEVREIDDLRWSSPPDIRHGVVWLYRKGADPVFRYVSWSDFLLARVERTRN